MDDSFLLNGVPEAVGRMGWKQENSEQQPEGIFVKDHGDHPNKQCYGSEQNHEQNMQGK